MTEQTTAPAATTPVASETQAAPQQATESPAQAQGNNGAERDRGADGKFQRKGMVEIWRTKPGNEEAPAQEKPSQGAAPPVPAESQPAAAPKPAKTDNFVPQPRFDQVIRERNEFQRQLAPLQQEVAQLRQQLAQAQAHRPPAQQEQLPPDVASYFGIEQNQQLPPQLQQALAQLPQLQQQVGQLTQQQQVAYHQSQLQSEAQEAASALAQHGLPDRVVNAAIKNAMRMIYQDSDLKVIDAAAMWLNENRDVLALQQPQAPQAPRQVMAAPPVPSPAPSGAPSAPVRPAYNAPRGERLAFLTNLLGR